jgi:mRNA-degrading endonuclease toxin of MazEF toxin-antitoxin module
MESPLIRRDEIYLASFPFGDSPGMKLRPVLTITGPLGHLPEVLVAYISSVIPSSLLPSDIVLDPATGEHAKTNLKTASVLRLHKLATIHGRNVVRRLGQLSPASIASVDERLRNLLDL